MKIIDMHSHYSTEKGYLWRTPAELAAAEDNYKFKITYRTEEEMAQDLRKANVKSALDLGFTMNKSLDEVKDLHDYAAQLKKDHPDAFLGGWAQIDPRTGLKGLRELERCIKDLGMVGYTNMCAGLGIPPTDESFFPFYELCAEAKVPALILVGYTGWGAGLPGGNGIRLDYCHPRYVDEIAARFPELTIVAGRPAWPWQDEMIAILLHKPNVWYEVHGWSPKYFTPSLKYEIAHRLQDKVMFGADYPIFRYERLFRIWEDEGYGKEVLDKLFYTNARRMFEGLGSTLD